MVFEKIQTIGAAPAPRYHHTMVFSEYSCILIVMGGKNENMKDNAIFDDIQILKLSNFE